MYLPQDTCVLHWHRVGWYQCWGLLLWSSGRLGCQSSCSSDSSAASFATSGNHRLLPSPGALRREQTASKLSTDHQVQITPCGAKLHIMPSTNLIVLIEPFRAWKHLFLFILCTPRCLYHRWTAIKRGVRHHSQTGRMAQAAADPLAVESTWMDVLTLASERQRQPREWDQSWARNPLVLGEQISWTPGLITLRRAQRCEPEAPNKVTTHESCRPQHHLCSHAYPRYWAGEFYGY